MAGQSKVGFVGRNVGFPVVASVATVGRRSALRVIAQSCSPSRFGLQVTVIGRFGTFGPRTSWKGSGRPKSGCFGPIGRDWWSTGSFELITRRPGAGRTSPLLAGWQSNQSGEPHSKWSPFANQPEPIAGSNSTRYSLYFIDLR